MLGGNMLTGEVLELMDPEDRIIMENMIKSIGYNEKMTADAVIDTLLATNNSEKEGIVLLTFAGLRSNTSDKFAPKLTFEQRCEVLALFRKGFSRELLSKLYRIDRRTITHIHNAKSTHYKNVREEEKRMGTANFMEKYLTPGVIKVVLVARGEKQPDAVNNKNANKKRGIHGLRNDFCDNDHRVIIKWVEPSEQADVEVAGWYYKDLDSEWPDMWLHSGPESMKNSQACYDGAKENIVDKIS